MIGSKTVGILTYVMARVGPVGDGWSFRGNGALVVPLGLGPALLAGAWVALVLRSRGAAHWRLLGVAAVLVGALPALSSLLAGRAGQRVSDALTLPAFVWPVVALLLAVSVPIRAGARTAPLRHGIAAIALTIGLVAGFVALGVVLPPGSG